MSENKNEKILSNKVIINVTVSMLIIFLWFVALIFIEKWGNFDKDSIEFLKGIWFLILIVTIIVLYKISGFIDYVKQFIDYLLWINRKKIIKSFLFTLLITVIVWIIKSLY